MTSHLKTNYTLHESIKSLDLETVQRALKNDPASLNILDSNVGWSVLYKAIVYEQYEIVHFLLESGADPNVINKIGESPLHYAVEIEKIELVNLLLSYGADPNTKQSDGNTPFNLACKKNLTDMVRLLLDYNADVNTQNKLGKTPLHFAGDNEDTELYELLLRRKANPDLKDKFGRKSKPLIVLPIKGKEESMEDTLNLSNFAQEKSTDRSIKEEDLTDKENMLGERKPRMKRPLNFTKHKLTTKNEILHGSFLPSSNESERGERILEDVTNVIASPNEWSQDKIEKGRSPQQGLFVQKSQNSLRTVKNSVLQSLQTLPKEQSSVSQTKPEKKEQSQNNFEKVNKWHYNATQLKLEKKLQNEMRKSSSELMKMAHKTSSPSTLPPEINENNQTREPQIDLRQENPVFDSTISNVNLNENGTNEEEKHEEKRLIPIPNSKEKISMNNSQDFDCCSAGQILNNKLFNIFCNANSIKEDDAEFNDFGLREENLQTEKDDQIEDENSMAKWLSDLDLASLILNFADNGYSSYNKFKKDYELCKAINQDLLYRFGIDKIGYRSRITMKLREDCELFTRKGLFALKRNLTEYPSVKEWLTMFGYKEYTDCFLDNGYDNLEYMILQTSFPELVLDEFFMRDKIGIKSKFVRDDILKRLRKLNDIASEMEVDHFDSKIFLNILCDKEQPKSCSIF